MKWQEFKVSLGQSRYIKTNPYWAHTNKSQKQITKSRRYFLEHLAVSRAINRQDRSFHSSTFRSSSRSHQAVPPAGPPRPSHHDLPSRLCLGSPDWGKRELVPIVSKSLLQPHKFGIFVFLRHEPGLLRILARKQVVGKTSHPRFHETRDSPQAPCSAP